MAVKKRVILAQRFFQARKMLSRCTEAAPRSRVKGRLRPYAAWCSVPSTRRRGDMLGRGSKCGSFALTAMQTGHFCRQLCAVFHRQQHQCGRGIRSGDEQLVRASDDADAQARLGRCGCGPPVASGEWGYSICRHYRDACRDRRARHLRVQRSMSPIL